MNREEFMKELEYLLMDIPEEDKQDAVAYYRDYLEDAGDEHEKEVIQEFGSPERVAAIIRADLGGNLQEGGEFTETGYQDERFREPGYQVVKRQSPAGEADWQEAEGSQEAFGAEGRTGPLGQDPAFDRSGGDPGRNRGFLSKGSMGSTVVKLILVVLLFCVVSPILLGVGGGAMGIAIGGLALVLTLFALAGVLTLTAWIGAAALIVAGIGMMFSAAPWAGVFVAGCGVLALGMALIGVVVCVLIYGKFLPFCICTMVNGISRLLHRGGRNQS